MHRGRPPLRATAKRLTGPAAYRASNQVYGQHWDVDEAETLEVATYEDKWPKGEYFIFDVQGHFTDGIAHRSRQYDFIRSLGLELDNSVEAYSLQNFSKEMFLDSKTDMVVISGVPGREKHRDEQGTLLEGKAREGGIQPSRVMSKSKRLINEHAGRTARPVPRQRRPQPLLGPCHRQARQGHAQGGHGARGEALRPRLLETLLPYRPRQDGPRLSARR